MSLPRSALTEARCSKDTLGVTDDLTKPIMTTTSENTPLAPADPGPEKKTEAVTILDEKVVGEYSHTLVAKFALGAPTDHSSSGHM